jgi:hypothetical protein
MFHIAPHHSKLDALLVMLFVTTVTKFRTLAIYVTKFRTLAKYVISGISGT